MIIARGIIWSFIVGLASLGTALWQVPNPPSTGKHQPGTGHTTFDDGAYFKALGEH